MNCKEVKVLAKIKTINLIITTISLITIKIIIELKLVNKILIIIILIV